MHPSLNFLSCKIIRKLIFPHESICKSSSLYIISLSAEFLRWVSLSCVYVSPTLSFWLVSWSWNANWNRIGLSVCCHCAALPLVCLAGVFTHWDLGAFTLRDWIVSHSESNLLNLVVLCKLTVLELSYKTTSVFLTAYKYRWWAWAKAVDSGTVLKTWKFLLFISNCY